MDLKLATTTYYLPIFGVFIQFLHFSVFASIQWRQKFLPLYRFNVINYYINYYTKEKLVKSYKEPSIWYIENIWYITKFQLNIRHHTCCFKKPDSRELLAQHHFGIVFAFLRTIHSFIYYQDYLSN